MFEDFPGFLGYGGIIAIHADWPIYPTSGLEWKNALRNIGNFPIGTNFYQIDDIDKAILFSNSNPIDEKQNSMNISIWHEDLIELQKQGLISGVKAISEYKWSYNKFDSLKRSFGEYLNLDKNGNIIAYIKIDGKNIETSIPKPKRSDYGDDYAMYKDFAVVKDKMNLTKKGFLKLHEINQDIVFSRSIQQIVQPLLVLKRYDTAIREISLLIESRIKNFHEKPNLFGYNLIEFHINSIIKQNNNINSAAIKCYKGELKTAFTFIRNEFAHNFKNISLENCNSILYRLNELNNEIDEVFSRYF